MTEFKHLLVPLDGSRLAESVLPATVLLAKRLGAEVTLLHVMEYGLPQTVHGEPHLADRQQAEQYLNEVASRLAAAGLSVTDHVHSNLERDVAGSIAAHAAELNTDMIILCTHGRSGLRNVLIGSIAQQVLQRGRRPVFLIRPTSAGTAPPFECHRLLVPLDGRPEHEVSLPVAEAIARACDAALHLLIVVPTLDTVHGDRLATALLTPQATAAVLDIEEEQAASYLFELIDRLRASGTKASAEVRRGNPANVTVEVASKRKIDLLVVATHGRSGLDALWTGSVAPRVLNRLKQPVLLVRVVGEQQ